MEERVEEQQAFGRIGETFILNIHSVRVFNEQIGPVADEHDQTVHRELAETLYQVIPQIRELEEPDVELVVSSNGDEANDTSQGDTETQEEPRRITIDPESLRVVTRAIRASRKRSPGQGPLLRQGALTTLLSFFEVLIAELVQLYYSMYPKALSEDQALTLSTLRELGITSVEDVEKYLASAIADKLLYNKSLKDQLAYFSKQPLGVNIRSLEPELKSLVEIAQRRHLLVHNKGVVNRQYLSKVDDELVQEYAVEEGERLFVTEGYLDAAIDTMYVVGLSLVQLCWRHWHKSSREEADAFIVNSVLYESLREERFELVRRMAERSKEIRYSKDQWKWMATVNHAIALKGLERPMEMESVLSSIDWSTSPLEFRIALHALRNEEEEFYQLLPRAVAAEEMERWKLVDWPVFAHQRGTEQFAEALERHFPSDTPSCSEGAESEQ